HRTVIQWSKDDIEALGFFKIDILALGGLTLIRKCLDSIQRHDGISLTTATIPPDDPATFDMICAADTIGTFQIESRAQMSFLPRHRPRNFYDLVVQVAIIRPGPIQGGMIHPYLRRRSGEEPTTFPDPRLESILRRTYGVPIFQEQVMRVAIAVGGFTPGEADELRKNIGAFSLNINQSRWIRRLRSGMQSNGIANDFIDTIMKHIHGFASYGFPESHAASFALLAYITAYLKCHYPAHFFASILNSLPMGFYSPDILVKTAQRDGVTVLPICVRHSNWDHRLECINGKWAIRLGFRLIQGIRRSAAIQIESDAIRHRHVTTSKSPIGELSALLARTKLNKMDLTALAAANAFHTFGISRRDALWLAEASPIRELLDDLGPAPRLDIEEPMTAVQLDYAATGTSLGLHPAALIRRYAWPFRFPAKWLTAASTIKSRQFKSPKVIVFGMITVRQAPPTAKGVVFITLWDETGSYDLILSPEMYQTNRKVIDRQSFLCIRGTVQTRDAAISIRVDSVFDPNEPKLAAVKFPETPTNTAFDESVRNYV
ncbi:error-prone DNA polymerase, partial [bacterium]|nr:error-prone DNA polymerase [bacterium]